MVFCKTGPPVTKNFPLRRLFPSDAMMAWRFYTHYDVKCTNLHILTARGMSHILTRIVQLWSSRKNSYALVRSPNSKITNQRIIDFNIIEWKSRRKFHFIGTLTARNGHKKHGLRVRALSDSPTRVMRKIPREKLPPIPGARSQNFTDAVNVFSSLSHDGLSQRGTTSSIQKHLDALKL